MKRKVFISVVFIFSVNTCGWFLLAIISVHHPAQIQPWVLQPWVLGCLAITGAIGLISLEMLSDLLPAKWRSSVLELAALFAPAWMALKGYIGPLSANSYSLPLFMRIVFGTCALAMILHVLRQASKALALTKTKKPNREKVGL